MALQMRESEEERKHAFKKTLDKSVYDFYDLMRMVVKDFDTVLLFIAELLKENSDELAAYLEESNLDDIHKIIQKYQE